MDGYTHKHNTQEYSLLPRCEGGGKGGRVQKKVKRTWERATVKERRTSEVNDKKLDIQRGEEYGLGEGGDRRLNCKKG